jgi:hypothetical protein
MAKIAAHETAARKSASRRSMLRRFTSPDATMRN